MIEKRVLEIIFEVTLYGVLEDINLDLSFTDDMDLSEVKIHEILEAIEEEYDVDIVDSADDIDCGRQIVDFVEENLDYAE